MPVRPQRPLGRALIDNLEPRRLFSTATPVAINFNDEALWDQNFDAAAAQAKALGVQSVRLWMGFDGYDTRPNAWDPVSPFGAVTAGEVAPEDAHTDAMPTVMTRAFQLKAMGFTVLAVLQPDTNIAADTPEQARAFVRHLMDATQTPDSTQTLKDVIDYWEIGNEVDSGSYWKPSAANKTAGIQAYVDQWLIPASQELHSGGSEQWEKIVCAGVSYDPNDLKTILNRLTAQGAQNAIDYAGFHPYGQWTSTTKEIATRTSLAKQYADAFGVKLIATEWNVRGLGNSGANNAAWVTAMNEAYRQVILPNYEIAYYFTLVNNWAGRGGTTSARPGGLLKHDTTIQVTPSSYVLDLRTYYRSPVIPADPFYSMFKSWQYGTVSGRVVNSTAGSTLPAMNVFVDVNGNGALDGNEPSAATDSAGAYAINYSVRDLPVGNYNVLLQAPADTTVVTGSASAYLTNATAGNVNFAVATAAALTASIGGRLFSDGNGDGIVNGADVYGGARVVYIDANANGKLDTGEKQTTSDAGGAYRFDGLTPGTYNITRVFPVGYRLSNGANGVIAVTVAAGEARSGVDIGSTNFVVTPPPPPPPPPSTSTGSISGRLFSDGNGDGIVNGADTYGGARVVYIDANANGKLDTGEKQTTSDASGAYNFTGLAAGTYNVTRVFPAGYRLSNGASGYIPVTIATGAAATGVDIGSTNAGPTPPPTGTTGTVSGVISGVSASLLTGVRAYIDLNTNGVFDSTEPSAYASSTGAYTISYPASAILTGTYTISIAVPTTLKAVTGPLNKSLTPTSAVTGVNFTVAANGSTPSSSGVSISGAVIAQISNWKEAARATPWVIYLDTNKNGLRDAGETYTNVAADQSFKFVGITAGTYTLALESVSGWKVVSPTTSTYALTLKSGAVKTDQNFVVAKV